MTVLERRPLEKIKEYILQLSPIKKAKSDAVKKYFDFSFQAEEAHVRGVCFAPEKWRNALKHTSLKVRVMLSTMYLEQNNQNSLLQIFNCEKKDFNV